jgi:large subunit ribosomal protein L10
MLYYPEEINAKAGAKLARIGFEYDANFDETSEEQSIQIYMKNTKERECEDGPISIEDMTLVYDGINYFVPGQKNIISFDLDTPFECLKDAFVGPTLIAYSMEHPGAAARLFKEFAKANAKFEVKAAAFEGELIPASQIDRLATLPTYEEAIARLMATMKEASAGKLVRTLAALRDKKEAEAA